MEKRNIIIIVILLIIICVLAGAIFGTLSNAVDYERIEVVPNGTSIEIPKNNASYFGEVENTGVKMWTFKQGCVMSYNVNEAFNARGLYAVSGAVGLADIEDMIITHYDKVETIDGYTVYTVDGDKINAPERDKVYCILVSNNLTRDVILIATDNKDISLHMAKSIQFKNANIPIPSVDSNIPESPNSSEYNPEDWDMPMEDEYNPDLDGFDDPYGSSDYDPYESSSSVDSGSSVPYADGGSDIPSYDVGGESTPVE